MAPGTFVISTRSGTWADNNYYGDTNNAVSPSPDANYFEVLSNLNESLRPFYRFESGSSLAAAEVSGTAQSPKTITRYSPSSDFRTGMIVSVSDVAPRIGTPFFSH